MDHEDLVGTDGLARDLRRRSVRAGAAVLSGQLVTNVLNLAATVVLARLLTPADFGLVAMVLVFIGFTNVLRDLGLSTATVQRQDIELRQVDTLWSINVLSGLILAGLFVAAAPLLAEFFAAPEVAGITRALAFVALIDALSLQHQALLRRRLRLGTLTVIEIVSLLVGIVVAIALARRGAGYWALVVMQLVQPALRTVLCWLVTRWRPRPRLAFGEVRPLLAFGGFITGSRLLNQLTRAVDRLLIGRFAGADPLGAYAKAYNGVLLPADRMSWGMTRVAVPTLSRLQNEPERFREYYLKALLLIVSAALPALAWLYLEAPAAVFIVLGAQWELAVPLLRVLTPVAGATLLATTMRWVFVSLGRTDRLLKWRIFESLGKIIAMSLGAGWGALGVATGLMVASLMLVLPGLWFSFQETHLQLRDVAATVWRPALATVAGMSAVLGLRSMDWVPEPVWASVTVETILFLGATLAGWLVMPQGKTILRDMWRLAALLRRDPVSVDSERPD